MVLTGHAVLCLEPFIYFFFLQTDCENVKSMRQAGLRSFLRMECPLLQMASKGFQNNLLR